MGFLTPLDLVVFFAVLVCIAALGVWAGRKEDTAADYYLAGRSTRWWGVAGSIFGTNVSADHLVGMMGIGYAVGFAQAHFEFTAIAGLLLLCYAFLPVFRKLNVYTLSEYLGRRYNDAVRLLYALIMLVVMVFVLMVPGFYIGSRTLNLVLKTDRTAAAQAEVDAAGLVSGLKLLAAGAGYAAIPQAHIDPPPAGAAGHPARASAAVNEGRVVGLTLEDSGAGYDPLRPPKVRLVGGAAFDAARSPGDVEPRKFYWGILLLALVIGVYTLAGGLKAVIITDVCQSLLLLGGGLTLAFIVFRQPEVGGWAGMLARDAADQHRLHLYNPMDHQDLPWSGVLTGLLVLHCYYWGNNQFIVQRALSARSLGEARLGVVLAGFFKLLIPFFSICTGIAAYYLFKDRGLLHVNSDAVFSTLLVELVAPLQSGLLGLIIAGVIAAIMSTLDSLINSAATIFTFDVYQRYFNPRASEGRLVFVGRACVAISILAAVGLTVFVSDPNSEGSFFLKIADQQAKLVAGVVVAFVLGMLWPRGTAAGALAAMLVGVIASFGIPALYDQWIAAHTTLAPGGQVAFDGAAAQVVPWLGRRLNFLHAVFAATVVSSLVYVFVSLATRPRPERSQLTWVGLEIFSAAGLRRALGAIGLSLAVYGLLALAIIPWGEPVVDEKTGQRVVTTLISPTGAACLAATWTWGMFIVAAAGAVRRRREEEPSPTTAAHEQVGFVEVLAEDRTWAGLLAAAAIFGMFYFA